MVTTVELKPEAARYISSKVAAGEYASPDALLNALVEERIAREKDYDGWFRGKVAVGLQAAKNGEFATDESVDAVVKRWS